LINQKEEKVDSGVNFLGNLMENLKNMIQSDNDEEESEEE
jgi:hypothetical protein